MSFGSKERASFIFASALTLAVIAGTGDRPKSVSAGGESYKPYCQPAIESLAPFDRAKKAWGIKTLEDTKRGVRILVCADSMARIDVGLGWRDYLKIIIGNSDSVDNLGEGRKLLGTHGYTVTRKWRSGISDWGVFSQRVDVDHNLGQ